MHTAYNRAYLATVLRTFAQIPHRGTSDTLGMLSEIENEPLIALLRQWRNVTDDN
jgi:hypothetical protein